MRWRTLGDRWVSYPNGASPAEDAAAPRENSMDRLPVLDDCSVIAVSREGGFAYIPALASPQRFVLADMPPPWNCWCRNKARRPNYRRYYGASDSWTPTGHRQRNDLISGGQRTASPAFWR